MKIPILLQTDVLPRLSDIVQIPVSNVEFWKIINETNLEIFYQTADHLYVVNQGVLTYTQFNITGGMQNSIYYEKCPRSFRFTNFTEMKEQFGEMIRLQYTQYPVFLLVKMIGDFSSEAEFLTFLTLRCTYDDYLVAKKKGFNSFSDFSEAKRLEFPNAAIYYQFKRSKIEDPNKFKFFSKEWPKRFAKVTQIIDDTQKDIARKYTDQNWSEIIRLQFLIVETLVDLLWFYYMKDIPQNKEPPNFNEKLTKIAEFTVDLKQLDTWRNRRNQIAHENFKITQQEFTESTKFLADMIESLLNYMRVHKIEKKLN